MPSLAMMLLLSWLSHQPQWPEPAMAFPDWLLHGGAYALLAGCNCWGLTAGRLRRLRRRGAILALVGACVFGLLDEFHQGFIPGRDMSGLDWLADSVGAAIASLALWLAAE